MNMTDVILSIIKTIVGYFILIFLTANLLGMVVRGIFGKTPNDEIEKYHPIIQSEAIKLNRANYFITIIFCLLMVLFYYLLFHFWNIGVVLVAAMLMIARLPDLLYEIRTGVKVTSKTGSKGLLKFIILLIDWSALVVLWFALS